MHQKQNALPTETADNISDPIIYSVEDLNIPCGVVFLWVFLIRFHLVTLGRVWHYCRAHDKQAKH